MVHHTPRRVAATLGAAAALTLSLAPTAGASAKPHTMSIPQGKAAITHFVKLTDESVGDVPWGVQHCDRVKDDQAVDCGVWYEPYGGEQCTGIAQAFFGSTGIAVKMIEGLACGPITY